MAATRPPLRCGRGRPLGARHQPYGTELQLDENSIIAAPQKLGQKRSSNAITEGKQLTLDDAIALALSLT